MPVRLVIAALLFSGAFSSAGDLKVEGPATVAAYKQVRLTARPADPKASVTWWIRPLAPLSRADASRVNPDSLPKTEAVFVGPPGVYDVEVLSRRQTKDGEWVDDQGFRSITILQPPLPPAPIPPTPVPPVPVPPQPGPTDPLFPQLQSAYLGDTSPTKAADARQIAAVYRNLSMQASDTSLNTAAELFKLGKNSIQSLVPLPRLQAMREVVAGEFDRRMGTVPNAPLTPSSRQTAAEQFSRFAVLFDTLAK